MNHFTKEVVKMVNDHVKRCSTSSFIKEMEIKTIRIYRYTPITIAKINKQITLNAGESADQPELSQPAAETLKW